VELVFYGKEHCSLCDSAREVVEDVLDDLHGQLDVTLRHVDIRSDDALFARFRFDVPVLALDGRPIFRHRVDPAALAARLVEGRPTPDERTAAEPSS